MLISVCVLRAALGWFGTGRRNRTMGRALSRGFTTFIIFFWGHGDFFWLMNWAGNDAYSQRASKQILFFKQGWEEQSEYVLPSSWHHYTSFHSSDSLHFHSCGVYLLPVGMHLGLPGGYRALFE
jgi:hypothetical protein